MFGPNIMVAHQTGFIDGKLNHPFGAGRQGWFTKRGALTTTNSALNGTDHLAGFDTKFAQDLHSNAIFFAHQSQQEMFGADIIMVKPQCLLLCQR